MHILNHISNDEYFHLPDVQSVDGLLDLISGCALAILGNVLDFRTYSAPNQAKNDPMTKEQQQLWKDFDRNDIPGDDHMAICYARGIALAVFQWICMRCIVKVPVGKVLDDLPSKQLVELLGALFAYKANAATWCQHKLSLPGFTESRVGKLLQNIPVFRGILSQLLIKKTISSQSRHYVNLSLIVILRIIIFLV